MHYKHNIQYQKIGRQKSTSESLLKWDYIKLTVDLSIPGYVTTYLLPFRHQLNNNKQLSPHHHVTPTYGAKVQYDEPDDDAPLLPEERIKFIHKLVGFLLYYAIAIDNTVLVALSNIGSEKYRATFKTMNEEDRPTGMKTNCCIGI